MSNVAPVITPEQKDAWRLRESERLSSTYVPLPRSWRRSNWFLYGVIEINWDDAKPLVPTEASRNHFAHVSMTDGAMVAFTENDAKGVADRQTKMKPGKYLTKFFGNVLKPEQITQLATEFAAEFAPCELKFATDADDIEHVYVNGPRSCMSYSPGEYSSDEHPTRAYAGPDLQIAYIENADRGITARAVIWPANKVHSTIYGDAGRLRPLLRAAGYKEGCLSGARLTALKQSGQYVVPYVDGISYGHVDGKHIVLSGSGGVYLNSTSGLSGPEYRCDCCGDGMSEDDGYYCEDDGETYCEHCDGEHRFYCERLERTASGRRYEMTNGQTWCELAFDRHGFTCAQTDEPCPDTDAVQMACGDTWSNVAFERDGFTCAGNGQHYEASEDLVLLGDGTQWSREHFDEYGATVDGVPVRGPGAPVDRFTYRCPDTLELELLPTPAPVTAGTATASGLPIMDRHAVSVGDWVQCLQDCYDQFHRGGRYQVTRVSHEGWRLRLSMVDDLGDDNGWLAEKFCLVLSAPLGMIEPEGIAA
jgi:hypothetical protein